MRSTAASASGTSRGGGADGQVRLGIEHELIAVEHHAVVVYEQDTGFRGRFCFLFGSTHAGNFTRQEIRVPPAGGEPILKVALDEAGAVTHHAQADAVSR